MYTFQTQQTHKKTFANTKTLCSVLKDPVIHKTVMLTPYRPFYIGGPVFATLAAAEQSKPMGEEVSEITAVWFYS